MITKNLLVKIFFLMLFGNLFAQEMEKDSISTKILDEVIITATRSLRQLSSIPLPVILIPKEKINQSGTIRLNEILVEQTGINIVQDQSGFKGVQMLTI
jgi:outer membrane receptor for ferrienterochelin and colicins